VRLNHLHRIVVAGLSTASLVVALGASGCSRPAPQTPRTFTGTTAPPASSGDKAPARTAPTEAPGARETPGETPASPTQAAAPREAPRPKVPAQKPPAQEAVLSVKGFSCQGCANAAAQAATRVPGVLSARGSFEDGTVVIRYEPGATTPEAVAEAISATDRGAAPPFEARVTQQ